MPYKTRLQLEVSGEMLELLNTLEDSTEVTSRAEVVRHAISVYATLVEEVQVGARIEIVNDSKRTRFELKLHGKEVSPCPTDANH